MAHQLKLTEKDVAKQIDDMLRLNGAQVWPIKEPFCPHCRRFTGAKQQAGIPDRFVLYPRRLYPLAMWIELKRPGGKVRPEQAKFMDSLGISMSHLIASSWEDIRDYLDSHHITVKVRG